MPPLKMNGQPESFRDSSREKARMDFSRSATSLMLGYWVRKDSIHALVRLSGLIIVLEVYIAQYGLNSFAASAAAGVTMEFGQGDAAFPEGFLVDGEYFGAL